MILSTGGSACSRIVEPTTGPPTDAGVAPADVVRRVALFGFGRQHDKSRTTRSTPSATTAGKMIQKVISET